METEEAVRDYYGKSLTSSNDLTTTNVIQCSRNAGKLATFVTEALSLVHEDITNRTYGCATAYPEALDGAKVLDLGAGCGRDCFVLSNIVGEEGTVVGLDMTDELLQLARDKVDYHTSKYGYAKPNVSFVKGYMENMKEAGINDDFFDVIVSNCVISLCTDKRAVLREAYRVLKPGGELYFSDMYREGQLPPEVLDDKKLWCEGLIGALTCAELHDIAKELGFTTPCVVRASSLPILDEEIENKLGQVRYASVTYRLFKRLNRNDQDNKTSAFVKYLGGIRGCEDGFTFDKVYTFKKGKMTAVDPEVANILSTSRFVTFFDVVLAAEQSTHSFQIVDPFKLI
ncbi:unnamed protein product [Candidula unifasciata]|uniref:Arsenite methyltransferase n=1 Tax=Candidula unifasciata TaxID=100452 RepID=A0A8S3ZN63_9EUPU|nr:unnamed protein product [Candidula unifasciata]